MLKLALKIFLVSFCTYFISFSCFAGISNSSITNLLKVSGITKQVSEVPGVFKAGIEQAKQQSPQIPEELYNAMISTINTSIEPVKIIDEIGSTLKSSLNENEIKHLTTWFESDLGKKITAEEEKASTPEAYQKIIQSAQTLLSDTQRVGFSQRIDKLMGMTDMAMKIQEYSSIATYSALMSAMQPEQPLNIEAYKSQVAPQLAQARPNLEQLVIVSMVYSYQNIDLKDLKKYETFIKDSQSSQFSKKVMEGMTIGLEKCISKWANSIATIAKEKGI